MSKTVKQILSAALTAAFLFSTAAGCARDASQVDEPNNPIGGSTPTGTSAPGSSGRTDTGSPIISSNSYSITTLTDSIYIAQTLTLPDDIGYTANFDYYDGKLYLIALRYDNDDEWYFSRFSAASIYSVNIDGTDLEQLSGYAYASARPDDTAGHYSIHDITIDASGCLWIIESWYYCVFNLPENFDIENDDPWKYEVTVGSGSVVRKLDTTGAELLSVDISSIGDSRQDFFDVRAFTAAENSFTGEEIIYLGRTDYGQFNNTVYVIDSSGTIILRAETENSFDTFIHMPDSSIAFPVVPAHNRDRVQQLQIIDAAAKSLGEIIYLPDTGMQVYNGAGGFDILISDNANIYGYSFGESEVMRLINWIESNVAVNAVSDVKMLPDGTIVCRNYNFSNASQESAQELLVLTKIPRSELPGKTILTMASLSSLTNNPAGGDIARFNQENLFYHIEIIDYSQVSAGDDRTAVTKMSADLIAGNIPDLFLVTYDMPFAEWAAPGLFADLYPYIDADPELSVDGFVEAAFRAAEIDGCLYRAFPGFSLQTIFGNAAVTGLHMGWNMDEFQAVLDAHPQADMPLGPWMGKQTFLRWYLQAYINNYINWETGEVSFDTPGFIQLLEVSDRISTWSEGETNPNASVNLYDAINSGRQIMWYHVFGGFKSLHTARMETNWEIAFKGFPVDGRNGHFIAPGNPCFAIAQQSANKDAAWTFLRTFLDKDYQIYNIGDFPTNKAAFDYTVDLAMETCFADSFVNGQPDPPLTQEDYELMQSDIDTIMSLIEASSGMADGTVSEVLMGIIMDSASDYFNGIISAEDAAKVIQSKVRIYVAERS